MTAGLIAHLNAGETAPPKSLRVGGTELIRMVDAGSLAVEELGPGGVSSMRFRISEAGTPTVTLAEGDWVEFWDITRDRSLFRGWVQALDIRLLAVGRVIDVTAIGIEVLLDWMKIGTPITIPAGTGVPVAIQSLVAASTGIGFSLRAFAGGRYSTQAQPIAGTIIGGFGHLYFLASTIYDLTFDGGSLREAILAVVAAAAGWYTGLGAVATVDFTSGLRVLTTKIGDAQIITTYTPTDYDDENLYVDSTHPGPSDLNFSIDASGVPHAVYIRGGGAAGNGLVSDGSGIIGDVAELSDDTVLTAAQRDATGYAYLAQMSGNVRGSFTREDVYGSYTPPANVRPGSNLTLRANSSVVAADVTFTVMSIHKTFFPAETWEISFGGLDPSAVRAQRRQTRTARA